MLAGKPLAVLALFTARVHSRPQEQWQLSPTSPFPPPPGIASWAPLRGGADDDASSSSKAGGEYGASLFSELQQQHADRLGSFMERFDAALTRVRTTCKSGYVASLFGASNPANIAQRRDRSAMIEGCGVLSELYADICAFASEGAWSRYAAASLRLQLCLYLLLEADAANTIQVSFVDGETLAAFRAVHEACSRKPKGTVAEAVRQLRTELAPLLESAVDLVHAQLLDNDAQSYIRGEPRGEGKSGEEMEEALRALEHMQHVASSLEQRCNQAEESAADLSHRLREAEEQIASSRASQQQYEASAQATEAAVEEAAARAREEATTAARAREEQLCSQLEESRRAADKLGEERERTLQEMQQHRVGATTLQQHATQLAETLSQLERKHASLLSAQHSLEQYCGRLSQLEAQMQQRALALAQPVPQGYASVSAGAHRELQLELQATRIGY